jgi:NAD(P)-dependent dehydrogenase (short-subunit alcohol dehydrogenase family)
MAARDVFDGAGYTILVNNAGIIRREDSIDFTEADWDDVMDVNLKALFFTSQAFAKEALKAETAARRIVNIASLLSFQGGIRVPSYTASKHGVAGLTKVLANEWAARGINVNAIAPGYIATNNTTALRQDPDATRRSSIGFRRGAGAIRRTSAAPPPSCALKPRATSTARCSMSTEAGLPAERLSRAAPAPAHGIVHLGSVPFSGGLPRSTPRRPSPPPGATGA